MGPEIFFLCLLAFFLPLFESLKTIALLAYACCWIAVRIKNREFHWRRPDPIESLLLVIGIVALASTTSNWSFKEVRFLDQTRGLRDTVTWLGLFWLAYRGGYDEATQKRVFSFITAGALFGLGWGAWQVYTQRRPLLEFNSAGFVTQSAIYLGIVLIAAGGRLLSNGFSSRPERAFWWAALLIFSSGLVLMGSRGGLLAVAAAALIIAAPSLSKRRREVAIVGIAAVTFGSLSYFAAPGFFQHNRMFDKMLVVFGVRIERNYDLYTRNDQIRFDLWRIGFAQATEGDRFLLGVGPRKFDTIDVERLRFDPPLKAYPFRLTHAHNLFLTKWAEEGILGLAAFLLLLGLWAYKIFGDVRPGEWQCVAAAGALIVPVVSGFFGTPWKQEHAILASILLGFYLSSRVR